MSNKEIKDFTIVATPALGDYHVIQQGGVTYKETNTQILSLITPTTVDFVAAGWKSETNTWTPVAGSFDSHFPNFVFTIPGDATGYIYVRQKIKYTQTTIKYGIVVKVSYGAGTTTVTVYGGGTFASPSYAMTSAAITNPYYATVDRPLDFPIGLNTWTTKVVSAERIYKYSPTVGYWYGGAIHTWDTGSPVNPYIGIGLWNIYMEYLCDIATQDITLTSSDGSESNSDYTIRNFGNNVFISKSFQIELTVSTQHWILCKVLSGNDLGIRGDINSTKINIISAYV
jgi:hypothetical protein